MMVLKLALLIFSVELQNRFTVVNIGGGYLSPKEKPALSILEVNVGEFQDYKIIPSWKDYFGFGLYIAGAKLFPQLYLNREDRTFEFVRELVYLPGGGVLPISLFIYSPSLAFSTYIEEYEMKILPNLRFQIIPISDLILIEVFNPTLFTKRLFTPGPYPHFEISAGVRSIAETFEFDIKFGFRTYSLNVPSLTQQESLAIMNYQQSGSKKIVGEEYNSRYGIAFFVDFSVGFGLPSYYITKIVYREEKEAEKFAYESEEAKRRVAELEKKLAELEKKLQEEAELAKKQEVGEEKAREKPEKEQPQKQIAKEEEKVATLPHSPQTPSIKEELLLPSSVISIDSYKDGVLSLSWKIPPSEDYVEVEVERCLGYNCSSFTPVSLFPVSVTSFSEQVVENQIYCYRISVLPKVGKDIDPKIRDRIKRERARKSGKVCTYVSYKGDIVRVYF